MNRQDEPQSALSEEEIFDLVCKLKTHKSSAEEAIRFFEWVATLEPVPCFLVTCLTMKYVATSDDEEWRHHVAMDAPFNLIKAKCGHLMYDNPSWNDWSGNK